MSEGANCLASSTTWGASAVWGGQAELSFCGALFSLPASGPATANTAIQNPRTTHLVQRPAGRLAIPRTRSMTTPSIRHSSHGQSRYIATPSWSSEFLVTAISRPPDTLLALLGPLVRHRKHLRRGSAAVARPTRFPGSGPASRPRARAASTDHRRLSWSDQLSLVLSLSKNRQVSGRDQDVAA